LPGLGPKSGVGETLQRERVRRQLALDDIASSTKISTRFLKAIESEDFASLPGLVFTRNFVRQYASQMEMDPEPLLRMIPRFDLDSAPMPQPPVRPARPLWDPRWNSAFASVAWTLLASGAGFAAWVHFNHPAQPTPVQAAAPKPSVVEAKTNPVAPAETASLTPAVLAVPEADPLAGHPVRVLLAAKEDSWIQATADGKSVFTGMLKLGERRAIGADTHVRLRTGNAGGIEISLNGKALDPLGPSGQIRSITLTAEGPQLPSAATVAQNPPVESSPI
jgi:cytoskeleton protein RodZ